MILSFFPNFLKNIKVQLMICYITWSFITNTRFLSKLGPILIVDSNIIYSLDGWIYIEHKKLYLLSINLLATSALKYYIIIQGKEIQLHASFLFFYDYWILSLPFWNSLKLNSFQATNLKHNNLVFYKYKYKHGTFLSSNITK